MAIEMDLTDVRREYESHGITRKEMDPDPFVQFGAGCNVLAILSCSIRPR